MDGKQGWPIVASQFEMFLKQKESTSTSLPSWRIDNSCLQMKYSVGEEYHHFGYMWKKHQTVQNNRQYLSTVNDTLSRHGGVSLYMVV